MRKYLFFIILGLLGISNIGNSSQRGSSAPYISGDTFREYADFVYDEVSKSLDPKKVKDGDVVFVKTDYLKYYFKSVHKKIKANYILVTHNSDDGVNAKFSHYIKDDKILAWFCQNLETSSHKKLHPIPIGIANKCWAHGNVDKIKSIESEMGKMSRNILLYMNFALNTNLKERKAVADLFKDTSFCVKASPKEYSAYLTDLAQSKFVLSPRGNGLDCHRTWEALLMGAIPIVKSSTLDPMFKNMPVLIVNDWSEINEDFLNRSYEKMQNTSYDNEKIYFQYWWKLIESYKN
ncbi:MAG: hypothetical protein VX777_01170 [Chlamydiota bacterium]|nr:hypothetical protein [Chlamydiota bacterium]